MNPLSPELNSPTSNSDVILVYKGFNPLLVSNTQSDLDAEILKESGYFLAEVQNYKTPLHIFSKNMSSNPIINPLQSIHFQNVTIRKNKHTKPSSLDDDLSSYKALYTILAEVVTGKYFVVSVTSRELRALNPLLLIPNDLSLINCKRVG